MKKIGLLIGSIALATTPVMAETTIAAEPVTGESNIAEGTNIVGLVFAALAAALIIAVIISSEDDDDDPISA